MARIIIPEFPEIGFDEMDRGGTGYGNYFGSPTLLKYLARMNNLGAELRQKDLWLYVKVGPEQTVVLSDELDFRDRLTVIKGGIFISTSESTRNQYFPKSGSANEKKLVDGNAWGSGSEANYRMIYTQAGIEDPLSERPVVRLYMSDGSTKGYVWASREDGNLMFYNNQPSMYASVLLNVITTPQLGIYSDPTVTYGSSYVWGDVSLYDLIHRVKGTADSFNNMRAAFNGLHDVADRVLLNRETTTFVPNGNTNFLVFPASYEDFRNRFMVVRGFVHNEPDYTTFLNHRLYGLLGYQTFPNVTNLLPAWYYTPYSTLNNWYMWTAGGTSGTPPSVSTGPVIEMIDQNNNKYGRLWVDSTSGDMYYHHTNSSGRYIGLILTFTYSEQI